MNADELTKEVVDLVRSFAEPVSLAQCQAEFETLVRLGLRSAPVGVTFAEAVRRAEREGKIRSDNGLFQIVPQKALTIQQKSLFD